VRGCQTRGARGPAPLAAIRPSLLADGDAQLLAHVNSIVGQPVGCHDRFHGGAVAQRDAKQVLASLNHVDSVLRFWGRR